jgi:hypothetical protein
MDSATKAQGRAAPWNKGKLPGRKPPLNLKEILRSRTTPFSRSDSRSKAAPH